jgi:uncharacterized protein YciI
MAKEENNGINVYCYQLKLTKAYEVSENWTPQSWQTIKEHAAWLDDLGKAGILICAGRTLFEPGDKRLFGIALIKAVDLQTAKSIMAADPAVQANIQESSIYPFSLSIRHFENAKWP